MPAVVRVKRRIDEEPLSAFVLNGKKRRRLEDCDVAESATAGKDEISTILKFAGTIKDQDDTATTQLARLTKEAARELVQQKTRKPTSSHTERARQEMRQSLHEQRFRVVNCMRTTLEAAEGAAAATGVDYDDELNANPAKQITIVDIEKQSASATSTTNTITEATVATTPTVTTPELLQPSDSDTGYVYDLYLPENEQQAAYVDLMDDNYLSVRAFDDLIYEDRYNNTDDDENDSEDSNQENYFANDYPDEEDAAEFQNSDDESEGTREIRHVVEKFVFEDDDEDAEAANTHSSDDEDYNIYQDPYVHTLDVADVAGGFADDVDYCDVDRYGLAYARYKARVLKSLQHNAQGEHDDDDDDDKGSDEDTRSDSSNEHFHSASENEDYYD